jgi:hypothetical protein
VTLPLSIFYSFLFSFIISLSSWPPPPPLPSPAQPPPPLPPPPPPPPCSSLSPAKGSTVRVAHAPRLPRCSVSTQAHVRRASTFCAPPPPTPADAARQRCQDQVGRGVSLPPTSRSPPGRTTPPPIHRQSTANPPSQGPIYRPIARGLARTTAAPLKYLRIKKESSSLAGLIMDSQEFNLRRRAALKRPNGQRVTFIASLRNAHLAWMEWDDRRGSIISWKGRQKGRAFR